MVTENILIRPTEIRYRRDSQFSYTCHACSRCCHDKIIQVNPYEVARLAQNRGLSTTEFLAQYTERNGTVLRRVNEGACVFLTAEGCGVHQDRPLVCRLYPLGRRVTAEDGERFLEVMPHPQTEGEYGLHGTVQEFLTRQGADPFIDAVDQYVELIGRMSAALRRRVGSDVQLTQEVQTAMEGFVHGQEPCVPNWLDMDRMVENYCAQQQLPVPTDVSDKMRVHVQAIETVLLAQSCQVKEG